MDKPIEEMTLAELDLYSAKLHDEFYAVKNRIQAVQQWRNRRGVEMDALRHIAEAQARLQEAVAITPPIVIAPESIKSDEAVVGTGGQIRRWLAKVTRVSAAK